MKDVPWLHELRRIGQLLTGREPAHDWSHVLRVEALTLQLGESVGAHLAVVRGAALLHEVYACPKNDPHSSQAAEQCAARLSGILNNACVPTSDAQRIIECVRVHSFSAGLAATDIEAQILQDADRLDAVGAIGVARCFATSASLQRPFYDQDDPFAERRPLDDKQWALDHFHTKLLKLGDRFHTERAQQLAQPRMELLRTYLRHFEQELKDCQTGLKH